MENELAANERTRWVRRGTVAIQIVGVLIILFSAIYLVWLIASFLRGPLILNPYSPDKLIWVSAGLKALDAVAYGLAALALVQLLRYVFGEIRERGLLLRFADRGLIIWAGLGLVIYCLNLIQFTWYHLTWWHVFTMAPSLMVPVARALVLVSLAMILRRALPIVEESRSLV